MHAKAMAGPQWATVFEIFLTKLLDTPFSSAKSDSQLTGKLRIHITKYGIADIQPLYKREYTLIN